MKDETKFMDINGICEYLNVKNSKVRSLVFYGEIPVIRIGRVLRFYKPDIDKWVSGLRSDGMKKQSEVLKNKNTKRNNYKVKNRYGNYAETVKQVNKLHREILCQEKQRQKKH